MAPHSNLPAGGNRDKVVIVVTILLTAEDEERIEYSARGDNMEPGAHIRGVLNDRLHVPARRIVIRDARAPASAAGRALQTRFDRSMAPASSHPASHDNGERIVRVVTVLLTRENKQQIEHFVSMHQRMTLAKYIRRQIADRWLVSANRIQIRESNEGTS